VGSQASEGLKNGYAEAREGLSNGARLRTHYRTARTRATQCPKCRTRTTEKRKSYALFCC